MIVEFHPAFHNDFEAAAAYYEERAGVYLRSDFFSEVFGIIERLKKHPRAFKTLYRDVRNAPLSRFTHYAIRYSYSEDAGIIRVLSLLHGARHPDTGTDRR